MKCVYGVRANDVYTLRFVTPKVRMHYMRVYIV
eukprot:COSAG02_NODE_46048_length_352_cov_0.707510_1_plen_32_part_01